MGDGGGCHPRDNIALSWLSQKLDLSYDFFEGLMKCRENQTEWLANLIIKECKSNPRPIYVLGKCFKKETNLVVGSPSKLLDNILKEKGVVCQSYDPYIDKYGFDYPRGIYFIGSNHDIFKTISFEKGSTIIDPWRMIKDQDGVTVIRVGE